MLGCSVPTVLTPCQTCRCVVVWQKGTITWSLGQLQNIEFSYLLLPLEATGQLQVPGGTSAMPRGAGAAGGLPPQQSRCWFLLLLKTEGAQSGTWPQGLGCREILGLWHHRTARPCQGGAAYPGGLPGTATPSKAATGCDSRLRMFCYLYFFFLLFFFTLFIGASCP